MASFALLWALGCGASPTVAEPDSGALVRDDAAQTDAETASRDSGASHDATMAPPDAEPHDARIESDSGDFDAADGDADRKEDGGGDASTPDVGPDAGAPDARDAAAPIDSADAPDAVDEDVSPDASCGLPAPTLSPLPPGMGSGPMVYYNGIPITLQEAWPSGVTGTIFYTTDGSRPGPSNPSSSVYANPVPVTICPPTLLTAVAIAAGGCISPVGQGDYSAPCVPPSPVITPDGLRENNDFQATITFLDASETICYALNGTPPTCSGCVCTGGSLTYSAPIPVNGGDATNGLIEITANACSTSSSESPTVSQLFDLVAAAPTMSAPAAGGVSWSSTGVTASGAACSPIDATASPPCALAYPTIATATNPSAAPSVTQIRYTIAPTAPPTCTTGTVLDVTNGVPDTIGIFGTETIQAIACKTGYGASSVETFAYPVTGAPDGG